LQSVAFDFVLDDNQKPMIIEISYGFGTDGINNVLGYWDSNMNWYMGKFNPQSWIIENLLKSYNN